MTNRPRKIGTAAETAVVKALRLNGFGAAERRSLKGGQDQGDITGTPGIAWEVKGGEVGRTAHGQPARLATFLAQTEVERLNSRSDIGVLVLQRKGFTDATRWWAVIQLGQLLTLGVGDAVAEFYGFRHRLDQMNLSQRAIYYATPIWLELGDLLTILRVAGHGDPLGQVGVA